LEAGTDAPLFQPLSFWFFEHGSGLGVHRWVVEQSFPLPHWFRRLRIRWKIRDDIHEAFLSLACSIIWPAPTGQPRTLLGVHRLSTVSS
jgi:hypothetical protein